MVNDIKLSIYLEEIKMQENNERGIIASSELPNDEYLKSIGKFIVTFSKFEENVSVFISLLLGDNTELVSTIANSMDIRERCITLRGICAYKLGSADKIRDGENLKKDKEIQELDKLFKNVQKAVEKRNEFIHSNWSNDPETGKAHRLRWTKAKQIYGWPEANYALVNIEEIEAETKFIEKVHDTLWKYIWSKFGNSILQRAKNNEDGLQML